MGSLGLIPKWVQVHPSIAHREYVKELRGDRRGEAIDIYHHIDKQELRKAYLAYIPKRESNTNVAILLLLNGVSVGLAYIVSQGNITATIIWFAITTGATAGPSYYKEKA